MTAGRYVVNRKYVIQYFNIDEWQITNDYVFKSEAIKSLKRMNESFPETKYRLIKIKILKIYSL